MEIKKCSNCGSFITSDATLCSSCTNKANYDRTLLKNYFDEAISFDSISAVSATTGVSPNSIQKYMQDNDYINSEINPTSFSSIQY